MMFLMPRRPNSRSSSLSAPAPIAITAITEPTPKTTPRVVSSVRSG